jgi:UPF0716 protein FxsA
MRSIFFLFVLMPVIEMFLLIKVGGVIGVWYTIGLVLFTAVIGVTLLKKQGLRTLFNAQTKAAQGEMPLVEIAEGFMLAIAGALLLTPGFVTDTIGFLLLTPGVRQVIARKLGAQLIRPVNMGGQGGFYYSSMRRPNEERSGETVIDGEFEEVSSKTRDTDKRLP